MDNIDRIAAEDGVVFAQAVNGEADVSALFKATGCFITVIPAAWTLTEVPAECADVSDLWRSDGSGSFR